MGGDGGRGWRDLGGLPAFCVARRGRCWLASGPCSWGGQLLSLCRGHTKHCGCLAAEWNCWPHLLSPTHGAPDFPGAGAESWQAVISRKRMGPRDTWRRKASGRKAGPLPPQQARLGVREVPVLRARLRVPAERPPVVHSQERHPGALSAGRRPPGAKAALGSWHQ